MTFKLKPNPRWENARYERSYKVVKILTLLPDTIADSTQISELPFPDEPRSCRYSTAADGLDDQNRIPPFLKEYEDGTTEESWVPI